MKRVKAARGKRRELPPIGTTLTGRYKGKVYEARVIKNSSSLDGKAINFRGNLYSSMSTAAKEITGYHVNGWRFWKL